MMTTSIAGLPLAPAALTDEKGNAVIVTESVDGAWLERILRPVCTAMGCSAGLATAPITGEGLVQMGILHSLSLAWHLGRALLAARFHKSDPITAVTAEGAGKLIFQGKHPPRASDSTSEITSFCKDGEFTRISNIGRAGISRPAFEMQALRTKYPMQW